MGEERILLESCSSSDSSNWTMVYGSADSPLRSALQLRCFIYPDGNVLESNVGAAKEADEVCVKTAVGLVPDRVERSVVLGR